MPWSSKAGAYFLSGGQGFATPGASSTSDHEQQDASSPDAPDMFCSWRKSPSGPCSCAVLLRGPLPELLNHLCCLGESTLVLRQPGLSLAKCTRFGLSVATHESGWQVLQDHLSGLETDTGRLLSLYLLANAGDRKPLIGLAEPGRSPHATIRLDHHDWNSPVVANLIDHFEGVPLDCRESRRLGAGAWLDEWESSVHRRRDLHRSRVPGPSCVP